MIVGKESVGKTSLLRRLLKDNTAGVSSTDGVDIVVNRCKINIEDGKWTTGKDIPDDKIQTIQRAMIHGSMTNETLDTKLKDIDTSPQHKQDIMGNESEERTDNNYVSIKTTTSSDLKPSTLMIDTSNTNLAEETDIGPLNNMSAYTNDSKGNIATLDDIHKMENNSGDQLVRLHNSKSDSKENEDVNKQVSLLMPLDLMSRVFSKTSTADVPTNLEALCGLWDFAGQKEFYATHQAFLTKSAVYLVVADITEDIFKQGVEQHSTDFQHVGDSEGQFDELRQAISEAAKEMPNWGELMPLKWILLEHLIEINKENGKKITTLFEMLKIAEHPEINISRKEDMLLFLRVQHEIGNIIFFEDIQDLIILNPQWLVDAFRCLASNTYNAKPQQLKEWTQFVQYGELSDMLITELFKSKCGGLFLEHREDVLKVMEKFDILVENQDTGFFIMPSKMPFSTFEVVCNKLGVLNCKRTSWLCLKFEFLPPAFFNHLSVWFIKNTNLVNSGCEKLLVAMSTDTIALQILSFSTVEKELGSTCSTIYTEIITKVKAIIQRYNLTIKFDLCFKCNEGDFHKDVAPYKYLQKNREFYCLQHQQAHKSEEVYLPWMKNVFEDDQTITETERYVPILGIGNKLAVAALDLGTTYSGYAYSFRSDFESNPLKISTNDWSAEGVHSSETKAPSLLLLNPDQSFNCFGYRAQNTYSELLDDDPKKRTNIILLRTSKCSYIIGNDDSRCNRKKELPAIKVFTESIRFLKDHFLERFTDKKKGLTIDDVSFVITVPAIWSDAAKQFMRVASEKAGIKSSQMMLAYEPEAAALFCSLLPEDLGIAKYFQKRQRLMIVDLGGGTADITVVKVLKREEKLTYIEHVYRVTGGAWGGNQVNKNFEKFLESVFGNDVMDEFKRDYLSQYLEMMIDFEVQKKTLSTSGTKTGVGIRFGVNLRHIFLKVSEEKILKMNYKTNLKVWLELQETNCDLT
ncbi:unnamed protein product [Mytilus edulis]|uniref:COR domain-containing protein n=1 Tax=Mytilus edulis TaxID=6550 RepID=A0A8S3UST5_MYTED|nr:unnamed protein product [Mytilus edulis]